VARACAPHQSRAAERKLLERLPEALARLEALTPADRHEVRAVLATLTSGMIFDLARFPGEDEKGLAAIETLEELDHYTYMVAGCVGPFWTVLHVTHRKRLGDWALREMSEEGVSFGKALQLTNVLRDVPGDLAHGRCYLPARELAALGLGPRELLETAGAARALPLYRRLIGLALEHYNVAWEYTLAIPRLEWRMRLACAWPLVIGLATLAELAAHPNPLSVKTPIKISRGDVRALLARSTLTVWSNRALAAHAARLRARIAV
jgi:farnesyl-diphosphate farnesyltransferase